jgi:hypothetical protein
MDRRNDKQKSDAKVELYPTNREVMIAIPRATSLTQTQPITATLS